VTAWAERITALPVDRRAALERALSVELPRYVPVRPFPKQMAALLLVDCLEVLYGGAARGAKTWWLLMEALRYADRRGYGALLLRNTMTDLEQEPDGLVPLSKTWLEDTDAAWHPGKGGGGYWRFPAGATLSFGYLKDADDHRRYKGVAWQMIGIDQAEEIRSAQYLYMFSRLTRPAGSDLPLRFRATANPGGRAHDFLVERFDLLAQGPDPRTGRAFMPARLEDNPGVDQAAYERSLAELPEVEYAQLRHGDWGVTVAGAMFKVQHLAAAMDWPREARLVRAWDLAATEAVPGTDPDYTVGVLLARRGEEEWVVDVMRDRVAPDGVDRMMAAAALGDGQNVPIVVEQEGRSAGRREVAAIRRALRGHRVYGVPPVGTKPERAALAAKWVNTGRVYLLPGAWVPEFVSELRSFPQRSGHDDQVDAFALAHNWLDGRGQGLAVGGQIAAGRIPEEQSMG